MEDVITIQDQCKGAALRRRMRDQDFIQYTFATAIRYKSRQMISRWWKGEAWPTDLEGVMESVLRLPAGFFQQIGNGVAYDDALKLPVLTEGSIAKATTLTPKEAANIQIIENLAREVVGLIARYLPEENLRGVMRELLESLEHTHETPQHQQLTRVRPGGLARTN